MLPDPDANPRADAHDRDKLRRWQQELTGSAPPGPAVYVLFLVSEQDTAAHDIFRDFRRSFEQRNAGFANLVIFGQHGVSSTVRLMLAELGLSEAGLPVLARFAAAAGAVVREITPLPRGKPAAAPGLAGAEWRAALRWAETKLDESPAGGALPELHRTLREMLGDLCAAVGE